MGTNSNEASLITFSTFSWVRKDDVRRALLIYIHSRKWTPL